jgi:hypothetical protein
MGSKEEQLYKMRRDEIFSKVIRGTPIGIRAEELQRKHNLVSGLRDNLVSSIRSDMRIQSGDIVFDEDEEAFMDYEDGGYEPLRFTMGMNENDLNNELNNYPPFAEAERQLKELDKPIDLFTPLIDRFEELGIHGETLFNQIIEDTNINAENAGDYTDEDLVFLEEIDYDKGLLLTDQEEFYDKETLVYNFNEEEVNRVGNYMSDRIDVVRNEIDRFDFDGLKESLDKKYNPDDFELNDEGQLVSIRDIRANQLLRRMGLMFPVEVNDKILSKVYSSYQGGMPSLEQQLFLRPMDAYQSKAPLSEGDRIKLQE